MEEKIKLRKYLKPYKWWLVLFFVLLILQAVLPSVGALYLAKLIEQVSTGVLETVVMTAALAIGIQLFNTIFIYATWMLFDKIYSEMGCNIKLDLAHRALEIDSKTFAETSSGVFLNRITSKVSSMLNNGLNMFRQVSYIIAIVSTLVIILGMSWIMGLIALILTVLIVIVRFIFYKIYIKNESDFEEVNEKSIAITNEMIRSEKDIKALGMYSKIKYMINDSYSSQVKMSKRVGYNSNHGSMICMVLCVFYLLSVIWVGINQIQLGVVGATAALVYVLTSFPTLQNNLIWTFSNFLNCLGNAKVAYTRVFEIFNKEKFPLEHFGNEELKNCTGEIAFDKVAFEYKDGTPVFKNLSFTIPANKTVAFVGDSGSGKSTILNLITKMYDVKSGKVLLDGVDIQTLSKESLRGNISLVNQFPYIFNASIAENLKLAKHDATDEEMKKALKSANIYEFVMSLPEKTDTVVGENGIKLSGGQKQRVAIARALLRDSKIIVFDESTSSLDNLSQREIKKSLDKLKGTRTVVIVAHRLSTIRDADIIFFLNQGKIIDQGTFEELYEKCAKFRELYMGE